MSLSALRPSALVQVCSRERPWQRVGHSILELGEVLHEIGSYGIAGGVAHCGTGVQHVKRIHRAIGICRIYINK